MITICNIATGISVSVISFEGKNMLKKMVSVVVG